LDDECHHRVVFLTWTHGTRSVDVGGSRENTGFEERPIRSEGLAVYAAMVESAERAT